MSIELMNRVWAESKAERGALLTLLAIADNADTETGEAFPGVPYLARKTRLSERAVRDATRRLVELGELEVLERGGFRRGVARANRYRVLIGTYRQQLPVDPPYRQLATDEQAVTSPQPSVEPPVVKKKEADPRVEELFSYWQVKLGRERSRLTPGRRKKIQARLSDGISLEQLKRAVDGCAGSDFHVQNGHSDLTLICRSEEKVEFFAAMAEDPDEDFFAGSEFAS